ncbi:MAG: class B sortase [Oscillospiraceae bacterium]|nr:class B sortase [Oscillospiraceae bacterium]
MAGKYLKKRPKKKAVDILLTVLAVLFAGAIVLSSVKLVRGRQERELGVAAYASLAQSVVMPQTPEPPAMQGDTVQQTEKAHEEATVIDVSRPLTVDLEALKAIDPHVVGWIGSDTGAINYPVVQGTDNAYYLNHLIDGTVNSNGSIFMDFRNGKDLSDRNTFIYGHNMRNGAMFASLVRYAEPGYYEAHPELLLVTEEGSFSLQVFAGCVVPGNSDLYQLSFRDDEEYAAYIEKVKLLSDFSADVPVGTEDRIVTLSTCSYDHEDARYLLFCRLVPMQ